VPGCVLLALLAPSDGGQGLAGWAQAAKELKSSLEPGVGVGMRLRWERTGPLEL
jgi:hypothetical protein